MMGDDADIVVVVGGGDDDGDDCNDYENGMKNFNL